MLGRVLDAFDLPFEGKAAAPAAPRDASAPADTAPAARTSAPATTAAPTDSVQPHLVTERIAINRASVEELQRLPRIGPVLAARIVAWRETHGPLRSSADLQKVRGIGANTAARLAPLVRFD